MAEIKYVRLWDAYSSLLSPSQREIANMNFNFDLTVSEIAEAKNISRQGVSECLSSAKRQLEEYETKLGFCAQARQSEQRVKLLCEAVKAWARENSQLDAKQLTKLDSILSRDYTAAARECVAAADKE